MIDPFLLAAGVLCGFSFVAGLAAGYDLSKRKRLRALARARLYRGMAVCERGEGEAVRVYLHKLLSAMQTRAIEAERLIQEHGLTQAQGVDGVPRLVPTTEAPPF